MCSLISVGARSVTKATFKSSSNVLPLSSPYCLISFSHLTKSIMNCVGSLPNDGLMMLCNMPSVLFLVFGSYS